MDLWRAWQVFGAPPGQWEHLDPLLAEDLMALHYYYSVAPDPTPLAPVETG